MEELGHCLRDRAESACGPGCGPAEGQGLPLKRPRGPEGRGCPGPAREVALPRLPHERLGLGGGRGARDKAEGLCHPKSVETARPALAREHTRVGLTGCT